MLLGSKFARNKYDDPIAMEEAECRSESALVLETKTFHLIFPVPVNLFGGRRFQVGGHR